MAKSKNGTESTENSIVDFTFDDDNEFFGIKDESDETSVEKVIEKVKNPTKKPATKTGTTTEEDDDDDDESTNIEDAEEVEEVEDKDFFGIDGTKPEKPPVVKKDEKKPTVKKEEITEEESEEGDEEENEEDAEKDIEFYTQTAKEFKEKGAFRHIEIKDGDKIDEDRFFELEDEEVEARVDEEIEGFMEDLGEDGQAFIKFVRKGGNKATYFAKYGSSLNLKEFDENNDAHVETVLKYWLQKKENLDDAELADRLDFYEKKGKKALYAKKWYDTIQKEDKEKNELLITTQENIHKQRLESIKEFNTSLKEKLNTVKAIEGFTFTAKEGKELAKYMIDPVVKVGTNSYVPELQKDLKEILKAETPENLEKLILLAKLIKGKFKVAEIAPEIKSGEVKKAQSKLKQIKQSASLSGSAVAQGRKSIADRFE